MLFSQSVTMYRLNTTYLQSEIDVSALDNIGLGLIFLYSVYRSPFDGNSQRNFDVFCLWFAVIDRD